MENIMIKDLIALANKLDEKGLRKEADALDKIIAKYAKDEDEEKIPKVTFENAKDYFFEKEMCNQEDFNSCLKHEGFSSMPKDIAKYTCIMHKTKKSSIGHSSIKGFYFRGSYDPNPIEDRGEVIYLYRNNKEKKENLDKLRNSQ